MRLDLALVERGLARSRSHARQLIDSGRVAIPFQTAIKPSTLVTSDTEIKVEVDPYVSRGAHKLMHALDDCGLRITGRVLDAGASTGGFTQVLLERGATKVYAVDVGHGQMVEKLRKDLRVVVHEGLNLRDLTLDHLDNQPVDYVVADVSFISLTMILEPILRVMKPEGAALVLVKPQFEVGRGGLDSQGVVINESARIRALDSIIEYARTLGWYLDWSAPSMLTGEKGNQETFCLFRSLPG